LEGKECNYQYLQQVLDLLFYLKQEANTTILAAEDIFDINSSEFNNVGDQVKEEIMETTPRSNDLDDNVHSSVCELIYEFVGSKLVEYCIGICKY